MCGINAIFAYRRDAPPVDEIELVAARECMRSRGPDAATVWLSEDQRVGFGHRRLAIIDLSPGGAQPMRRGGCVIVFNGEIYNFRDIRRDLGGGFTSESDTEVLLKAYQKWGPEMLGRLRGMFAFALWD